LEHPFASAGTVYVITDVPEVVDDAVTSPVLSTVATAVLLLAHAPPDVASFKLVVVPIHRLVVPVMDVIAGREFTVIALVVLLEQLFAFGDVV